jgi:uncharacterized protein
MEGSAMAWNDDVHWLLLEAIERNDLEEFQRLLESYPDNIRYKDGTNVWLGFAARDGQLPFVKLLVELGVDLNEPTNLDMPEGAIDSAAMSGHTDTVLWLLEHGAKVNYEVEGQMRCLPLSGAAMEGHLEIVKLLVEHGADVNASWAGMNALMQAEMWGHDEVAEYLRSVGAKDVREATPPDYRSAHKRLTEIIVEKHGKLGRWKLDDSGDPPFAIRVTQLDRESNSWVLFTLGMSDRHLELPDGSVIATELTLALPADWRVTKAAMNDPRWNWPVEWLRRIARTALDSGRWPAEQSAIFMNGDPPAPFAESTKLCGWLCLTSDGGQQQMPDFRWIEFRDMFAIYSEEYEFLKVHGYEKLVQRFHERNVPLYLELTRENVATDGEGQQR